MIRALVIFVAALLCGGTRALAQPTSCVDQTAQWTVPYQQGSIQGITYILWQQIQPGPQFSPVPMMAVLFRTGEFHLHVGVPLGVAQRFTSLSSADAQYNSSVKNTYGQALLSESLCPILNENGCMMAGERPAGGIPCPGQAISPFILDASLMDGPDALQ